MAIGDVCAQANSKREKLRENHDHVVFPPFAFAVSGCSISNLSIVPSSFNAQQFSRKFQEFSVVVAAAAKRKSE